MWILTASMKDRGEYIIAPYETKPILLYLMEEDTAKALLAGEKDVLAKKLACLL